MNSLQASILSDGRDETTLMLPDISKNDLLNLVKILYGGHRQENQTHCSSELLHMLGIKKLPKLIPRPQNTSITREYFFKQPKPIRILCLQVRKLQNEYMKSSHCPKIWAKRFEKFCPDVEYFGQCDDFIYIFILKNPNLYHITQSCEQMTYLNIKPRQYELHRRSSVRCF